MAYTDSVYDNRLTYQPNHVCHMVKQPAMIQTNGRVSIDAETRRELGLEQGDYVLIEVTPLDELNGH